MTRPRRALQIAVVVGNPRSGGKTSTVAIATAEAIRTFGRRDADVFVIELADLATQLVVWDDQTVASAKESVLASDLLIVASPVYKASFTGLLKLFVERFGRDELAALATVPVMVGSGDVHTLAIEQQLRPVLQEIGASCPTRGVYVRDDQLSTLDAQLSRWLDVWGNVLMAAAATRHSDPET